MNFILGALLVAGAALWMTRADALGVLVGVALSCANFSVMRRMVQRWLRTAADRRGPQMLVLIPKMTGLMLAVFLAVFFLPVTGIGVLIGFSVFLGSIAIETVRFSLGMSERDDAAENPDQESEETRRQGETDGL
ncbi:ATP synthase subunit I [Haliangium ochraceum]|nr:ATP synthase subunit I [Haliangium ochraceum]